ncbi:MAG: hypothetical protein WBZ36_16480, partial [Candidatus Nitrosopolaris sp.]
MMTVVAFLRAILSSSVRYTFILSTVTILSFVSYSNPILYAHTFSENEDALFLTMINKIKAETQLVGSDFSTNIQEAQQHAKAAEGLFTQEDPVVNTTWTSEISERNPRVVTDLLHSLDDLKTTIAIAPNSNPDSSSVQSKVTNIGNLLDEAVSVRISKDVLDNPKTQALMLANLGNEIYNNYGNALGLPPSTVANMGGMSMSGMTPNKGSSMNAKMSSGNGMSGMNAVNEPSAMSQPSTTIKNLTAYQTAQSMATVAQEVFEKNLKPMASANTTNSNSNIANYLDQLKNAVNNKSPFMNVMELVHVKLHPTLISAYNLRLSMPGMSMPSKGSS